LVKVERPTSPSAAATPSSPGQAGGTLAVLDASPNPIVAVDAAARITYLNPQVEMTFGYTADELLGEPIEILLPRAIADRHVAHRNGFLANPVARPMGIGLDLAGRRRDGTEFPVEISLTPVETPDGLMVFATVVDITARKSAENQLLQAQKLESIGRLAGGIAHDFNNVLFAIKGYAELLAEDLSPERRDRLDPEDSLQSVKAITDAATRAASLTAQLLAFSRRQVVRPEVLELNDAIESVEPLLRRLIGAHVRLVVRPGPRTGRIRADHGQLDQILVNLVINARDAMPDGGTITIESGNIELDEAYALQHLDVTPGPYVVLSVSDTGPGMDVETREHVFEPFFTTKQQGQGTGLGLATIYGIVQQAGGHIWLYSEPGLGSSFKLYFPRVDAPAGSTQTSQPARASAGSGAVMVVEDESAVRDMTATVLRRAGYTVTPVGDGAEALERLIGMAEPIDVLVTDVVMPGMSGIDLAERVLDRFANAGVVLLSGYTAETLDLDRVVTRGAIFLPKPVTSNDLLDAVRRARQRRLVPNSVPR
jgi:two-component system cell cycle sensor histidine kinase/response regulator CckA